VRSSCSVDELIQDCQPHGYCSLSPISAQSLADVCKFRRTLTSFDHRLKQQLLFMMSRLNAVGFLKKRLKSCRFECLVLRFRSAVCFKDAFEVLRETCF